MMSVKNFVWTDFVALMSYFKTNVTNSKNNIAVNKF